jgi:2-polyprenyl-3-methyl-5-hydroxy-6-metoxy-1,4-benzoquinol methylase
MYLTENLSEIKDAFSWQNYLPNKGKVDKMSHEDLSRIFEKLRKHLKENGFNMTIALSKAMKTLLKDIEIKDPEILELGAATGYLTKWLINQYGGNGTLIDSSEASHEAFLKDHQNYKSLTYIVQDIFALDLDKKFDITCSFGLIEHFSDKKDVIEVHKKFLKETGYTIILVPYDSPLTRAYYDLHPEVNLGYRELINETEFKEILKSCNLNIIKTSITSGYVYDFIAAVCKLI